MADWKTSHETPQEGLTKQPGLVVRRKTWVGDYTALEGFTKELNVGRKPEGGSSAGISDLPEGFVASVELARLNGKRGSLTLALAKHEDIDVWGLEMTELQKPIKTWKRNAPDSEKPDLTLLANWEGQAGNQAFEQDYNNYRYRGEALTGNTLTLAKMIREEGIEAYVAYTPIITCTSRLNELPGDIGEDIGKIGNPTAPDGTDISKLVATAKEWLKTADRIEGALDGTYTRVEQWTGADKWNPNLYETATGSGTSNSNGGSSSSGSGGGSGESGGGSEGGGDSGGSGGGGLDIPDLPPTPDITVPDLPPTPEL